MNIHHTFERAVGAPAFAPIPVPKKPFMDFTRQQYLDGKITQIELAIQIAWYIHQGEFRRSDEPYFNHVWRVAHPETYYPHLNLANSEAGIIRGLLHDALEKKFPDPADNWTPDDLRYMGLDEERVEDIVYLTKEPGELDFDYAVRMSRRHGAMETKIVDNTDNKQDAAPHKKKIYGCTIFYYSSCLNGAIQPGTDIGRACAEAGMYDAPLFAKYYSRPSGLKPNSGVSFISPP